jgi:hypothetical protein
VCRGDRDRYALGKENDALKVRMICILEKPRKYKVQLFWK